MAAKSKQQIPSWFNPHHKPDSRWVYAPEKTIKPETEISRTNYSSGEDLILKPDAKYRIETEHDLNWGSCYYPNDPPSVDITITLVEYSVEEFPNPQYKTQLKRYNEEMSKIDTWDGWKKIWDADEARKKEIAERRKLAELKKKYEK